MQCKTRAFFSLVIFFLPLSACCQQTFNADSVYQHIRTLSETIGPRPMGSYAERSALDWVVKKFRAYGADSAYVMRFTEVFGKRNHINTNSGVAVGLFRGKSDTCLAVGSHIDSNSPESAGANDNASGTATVIELARLWGARPRHYTLLFLSFGGEEMGFYGSQYFVDTYKKIRDIGLMISADMTGAPGEIITIMENKQGQAPRRLMEDAFRLNRSMGINPLRYPTHFGAINTLLEAAGSDHDPFLKVHIPALVFSTGLNTSPIHSAQDQLRTIDKSQLDQCGRFIDTLLIHYQSGTLPARKLDHYILWELFGRLLFIPPWLGWATILIALAAGLSAFLHNRRQRIRMDPAQRPRFAPLKLALLFSVVLAAAQTGEALIQAVKGLRYPWLVHVTAYLWLMIFWAIGGLWLALRIGRRWRWNPDPSVYAGAALILLALSTAGAAFLSVRLATYPAASLLLFSLAVLCRPAWLKALFGLLTPLPMLRLALAELTEMIARLLTANGSWIDRFFESVLYTLGLSLVALGFLLPFILSFAWVVLKLTSLKKMLQQFRSRTGGVLVALLLLVTTWHTCRLPSHDADWRPSVRLNATNDLRTHKNSVILNGNEYFEDIRIRAGSQTWRFDGRTHKETVTMPFTADWMTITGEQTARSGKMDTVQIDWLLHSAKPWHTVKLLIRPDTLTLEDVESPVKFVHHKNKLTFEWGAQPPESLWVQASWLLHPGARLIRSLTAVYAMPPTALTVTSTVAAVSYRTTLTQTDTLEIKDGRIRTPSHSD
ncbi:M28 family peptidase [bacterium]|nr:M28 family peptidase [bacterium]